MTESQAFHGDTTDLARIWEKSAVTGRGLDDYLHNMHLSQDELIGKRILDVGAGAANFARDIQSAHLDCDVISLDPDFALDSEKRAARRIKTIGWRGKIESDPTNSVAAIAQRLPFANATFDLVLASSSVPEYFPSQDMTDYQKSFYYTLEEFDRILKQGGEARIFPMSVHLEDEDDPYEELPHEKMVLADFLLAHAYEMESMPLGPQKDEWRAVLILRKSPAQ